MSRSYIAKVESGEGDIPLSLAARIAEALGVPMDELVRRTASADVEAWHQVGLRTCRVLHRLGLRPADATSVVDWFANILVTCTPRRAAN